MPKIAPEHRVQREVIIVRFEPHLAAWLTEQAELSGLKNTQEVLKELVRAVRLKNCAEMLLPRAGKSKDH